MNTQGFRKYGVTADDVNQMVKLIQPGWDIIDLELAPTATDLSVIVRITQEGQSKAQQESRTVVLKAIVSETPAECGQAEPRLLELVSRETSIPVPRVYGNVDNHEDLHTPFYCMEFLSGTNTLGAVLNLPFDSKKRFVKKCGEYLAELHECGPVPGPGRLGYVEGAIQPIEKENRGLESKYMPYIILREVERNLRSIEPDEGFAELADRPDRFSDLVNPLRSYLIEKITSFAPDEATYCHTDYSPTNLLIDEVSGEVKGVIDWGRMYGFEPVYNLAYAEEKLIIGSDKREQKKLRQTFRTSYENTRGGWSFTTERCERLEIYKLCHHLEQMAFFPHGTKYKSPQEKDKLGEQYRKRALRYIN